MKQANSFEFLSLFYNKAGMLAYIDNGYMLQAPLPTLYLLQTALPFDPTFYFLWVCIKIYIYTSEIYNTEKIFQTCKTPKFMQNTFYHNS